jgi:hypothetical protein
MHDQLIEPVGVEMNTAVSPPPLSPETMDPRLAACGRGASRMNDYVPQSTSRRLVMQIDRYASYLVYVSDELLARGRGIVMLGDSA